MSKRVSIASLNRAISTANISFTGFYFFMTCRFYYDAATFRVYISKKRSIFMVNRFMIRILLTLSMLKLRPPMRFMRRRLLNLYPCTSQADRSMSNRIKTVLSSLEMTKAPIYAKKLSNFATSLLV